MLGDFLTKDNVRLNVEGIETPEDAIRYGGRLLMDTGEITQGYIDSMVEAFHAIGPYIVMAPGIAMPHARPSKDVLAPCVSMIRLKKPVCFHHPYNDPVQLVFALAGKENHSHIEVLQELCSFLEKENIVEKLLTINSYEELEQLF